MHPYTQSAREAPLPWKTLVLFVAASAALNVPVAVFGVGGDILIQYVYMQCFAEQFWAGFLFPSWCFSAFTDLGAPYHLHTFPLPYYVTSLIAPLGKAGFSLELQYAMACSIACLVSAVSCWRWLRDFASPGVAVFGALLYLYIPYRNELLVFRAAYYELWSMAFLPLVALYARRMAQGEAAAVPRLSIVFALLFLCHPKIAVLGGMLSGLYLLAERPRAIAPLAAAFLWGTAIDAFFFVPAVLYKPFVLIDEVLYNKDQAGNVVALSGAWPNKFIQWTNFAFGAQGFVLIGFVLTSITGAALMVLLYLKRAALPIPIRREAGAWALIFVVFFVMLFSISAPVWETLRFIVAPFPWRMQHGVVLATVFFLALLLTHVHPPHPKTAAGNAFALLVLLTFLGFLPHAARDPGWDSFFQAFVESRSVDSGSKFPIWNEASRVGHTIASEDEREELYKASYKRYQERGERPKIVWQEGNGSARVTQWDTQGIRIETAFAKSGELALDHHFFPLWRARTETDGSVSLRPEEKTGRMIVSVPEGTHTLSLSYSLFYYKGFCIVLAYAASLLSLAAAVILARRLSSPTSTRIGTS